MIKNKLLSWAWAFAKKTLDIFIANKNIMGNINFYLTKKT